MNDEFYIGWQNKAPMATGRLVRGVALLLVVAAAAIAGSIAVAQRTIGRAEFEWGHAKDFTGTLRMDPVPHLIVKDDTSRLATNFYLVNPFKFGFDANLARQFDGHQVTLRGTLIHRGDQRMIEVARNSIRPLVAETRDEHETPGKSLGERTFVGEIVDSKCWLGAMNPGQLKPHRACAVRCISGGIPPILLVRQKDGTVLHLLLVSRDGKPVNKEVLPLVAEPVKIRGELVRNGEILTLRAEPSAYRRL